VYFENSILFYLYISHNRLYIRLRRYFNIFMCIKKNIQGMSKLIFFVTPRLHVNHFQYVTASIQLYDNILGHVWIVFSNTLIFLVTTLCTIIINPCVIITTLLILHTSKETNLVKQPYHTSTNVAYFLKFMHRCT
jgi:hypothetical protein